MSFHRLAVKLAPLSLVTTDGTPYRLVQWCKKAVAASEEDGSLKGIAWKFRVVRQMAVSKYL